MTFAYRKVQCQGYTDFDSECLVVAGRKITIAVEYKLLYTLSIDLFTFALGCSIGQVQGHTHFN